MAFFITQLCIIMLHNCVLLFCNIQHLSGDTIRKLMRKLDVQVSLYNRHRNGKYSSYHGTVGKVADNKLKQGFN